MSTEELFKKYTEQYTVCGSQDGAFCENHMDTHYDVPHQDVAG